MRLIRLAVIAVLFPVVTHAQQDPGAAGRGQRMFAALFQGITLTDAQQKQVDSIRAAYRPQIQSAERDQRRDLMRKESADFRTILTPDQQTTYDKNLADMRSRMSSGGPPQ
jgi:Spy/CpxP family protein refolding chaperone